jgi:stage II sporulation protein D
MNTLKSVPEIEVGILSANEIYITLNTNFYAGSNGFIKGDWKAAFFHGTIVLDNGEQKIDDAAGMLITPVDRIASSFTVHSVVIGVDFHWQRNEDQEFRGKLRLIVEEDRITLINILSVEEYLLSVISSEMSAGSTVELLKAHAVISRGWLLAQIEKRNTLNADKAVYSSNLRTDDEIVRWYDREDHNHYDVCADDHCQRYQGITRASSSVVKKVIEETFGEVLIFEGKICDTRFYKCCGGMTELFENVWEPVNHPYLEGILDSITTPAEFNTDLTSNENAKAWIEGSPDAFCNTSDKKILSQVLNDYDQETKDFYRWKVSYSQEELSNLVKNRTGIDFGTINNLIPLERGASGRIKRLRIEGTKKSMIIGKELEIRKALSLSHLYSSCFVVDKLQVGESVNFTLIGAGWGHGVGLCQIGAAVMGSEGYDYRQILSHYFRGAILEKKY